MSVEEAEKVNSRQFPVSEWSDHVTKYVLGDEGQVALLHCSP